jgi:hypothetical protein
MQRYLLACKLATNFLFHLGHVLVPRVFCSSAATLFLYGALGHARGTSPPRVALPWRGWTGAKDMLGTILIILLILLLVGALPTWPYSTGWGYYPGGGIGLILIIVLLLVLVGRI